MIDRRWMRFDWQISQARQSALDMDKKRHEPLFEAILDMRNDVIFPDYKCRISPCGAKVYFRTFQAPFHFSLKPSLLQPHMFLPYFEPVDFEDRGPKIWKWKCHPTCKLNSHRWHASRDTKALYHGDVFNCRIKLDFISLSLVPMTKKEVLTSRCELLQTKRRKGCRLSPFYVHIFHSMFSFLCQS